MASNERSLRCYCNRAGLLKLIASYSKQRSRELVSLPLPRSAPNLAKIINFELPNNWPRPYPSPGVP
jgi:hypothetical protein